MKRRRTRRNTPPINQRVGIWNAAHGGLERLGYFTPQVQRVVKRWKHRERFAREYFHDIAGAALWNSNEIKLRVHARAHWPMVWELAAACDYLRKLPKKHPTHWLLQLDRIASAVMSLPASNRRKRIGGQVNVEYVSWREICAEIKARGGPDFSDSNGKCVSLRKQASRLKLADDLDLVPGYLRMVAVTQNG